MCDDAQDSSAQTGRRQHNHRKRRPLRRRGGEELMNINIEVMQRAESLVCFKYLLNLLRYSSCVILMRYIRRFNWSNCMATPTGGFVKNIVIHV